MIPNNTKPTTPILDGDVLIVQESISQNDLEQHLVGQVARVLLTKEFMKEGRNTLGLILSQPSTEDIDSLNSKIGEDITKPTPVEWESDDLENTIDFKHSSRALTKYYSSENIQYYQIGDRVYKVLVCTPYYNIKLKQWQVLVPLQLKKSETLFVKFSAIKIAPGHGKALVDDGQPNSEKNPYTDPTQTNWSSISDPLHLPIYGTKHYHLERMIGTQDEVKIVDQSKSAYTSKTYFVLTRTSQGPVHNLFQKGLSTDKLKDFAPFHFKVGDSDPYSVTKGKVLMTSCLGTLYLEISQKTRSILILEAENHENADIVGTGIPELFSDKNPLFDFSGLRFVNMVEFDIENL